MRDPEVTVIGAGPAGLFAAERLLGRGIDVKLYDAMPSPGRKFLVAGSCGGLNITNSANVEDAADRYGVNRELFTRLLGEFSPDDLIAWVSSLGLSTRVGSGGKVFPEGGDAPQILERWMDRLYAFPSFSFFPRHRLVGVDPDHELRFETPTGSVTHIAPTAVFALGGASWPSTGSDGAWTGFFGDRGIGITPLESANCGFEADWPEALRERYNNVPLKNLTMEIRGKSVRGELMLTPYGIEGGLAYVLGREVREELSKERRATVYLDLLPDLAEGEIQKRLDGGPGRDTLTNWFRKRLKLPGAAVLLMREAAIRENPDAGMESLRLPAVAAALVKRLPMILYRARPIGEAISSAGGVLFSELDDRLMLKAIPGWFCAGEMLDWEAPTGGFMLQGCFSTAYRAAESAAAWARADGNG